MRAIFDHPVYFCLFLYQWHTQFQLTHGENHKHLSWCDLDIKHLWLLKKMTKTSRVVENWRLLITASSTVAKMLWCPHMQKIPFHKLYNYFNWSDLIWPRETLMFVCCKKRQTMLWHSNITLQDWSIHVHNNTQSSLVTSQHCLEYKRK